MSLKKSFANADIKRITIGVPDKHRHIRTVVETIHGDVLIFQEATIANIVRGYTVIKTHPRKRALELEQKRFSDQKEGYADYQLVEIDKDEDRIARELAAFE